MTTETISLQDLTQALEDAIRCGISITELKDKLSDLEDMHISIPEPFASQKMAQLEAAEIASLELLDLLITQRVGQAHWTVLLAGHLIHSNRGRPVIIPIEKVTYLDNLRRFP